MKPVHIPTITHPRETIFSAGCCERSKSLANIHLGVFCFSISKRRRVMRRTISLLLIVCYVMTFGPLSCAKSRKSVAPEEEVAQKETPSAEKVTTEETLTVPRIPKKRPIKYKEVKKIVTLQEATVLSIELKETCSSETAKQGDRVIFEVMSDIKVEGAIVIREGTPVTGSVVKAEPAKWLGRAGELIINVEYTRAVDDQKIPLRVSLTEEGKDSIAASVVLTVLCCPLFLLIEGKKAECLKGAKYTVYVAADRKITGIERIGILE
jgi:hypothetical protein